MNVTVIKDFINSIPTDLIEIIETLEYYGFDMRIVGGAVRDILLDNSPRDIDIATDATPDEIMFILNRMKSVISDVDSTGLEHGTIRAITIEGNEYEITSLAFRMRERSKTIKVTQHRDWKIDALRRDFTFNAMSVSMNGTVFDYLGGLRDLVNQRVRFIGFYKTKILLEPKVALRFAKTLAKFPDPKYNKSIIDFLSARGSKLLSQIKPNTLKWFLDEIRLQPYPDSATPVLRALGIPPRLS